MLRLEHITYRYSAGTPFEVKALDDVTLDIRRGRITGLIGHTGSGKSTLVQLLKRADPPGGGAGSAGRAGHLAGSEADQQGAFPRGAGHAVPGISVV